MKPAVWLLFFGPSGIPEFQDPFEKATKNPGRAFFPSSSLNGVLSFFSSGEVLVLAGASCLVRGMQEEVFFWVGGAKFGIWKKLVGRGRRGLSEELMCL